MPTANSAHGRARPVSCRRPAACLLLLLAVTALGVTLFQVVRPALAGSEQRVEEKAGGLPTRSTAAAADAYGRLPLQFEANRGQADGRVRFVSRGNGYVLFLTADEAVITLRSHSPRPAGKADKASPNEAQDGYRVLRMKLVGASQSPRVEGVDEAAGKLDYFVGNDPSAWRTNVPVFGRVRYGEVYPGVGLEYYGNQRQLEYDFRVAAGADPRAIRIKFEGAERAAVDKADGSLSLSVGDDEVRMERPVIYQIGDDGGRQEVEGGYKVRGREVEFSVGSYDAGRPLVIDPILSYASYLGAGGSEAGYGIAVGQDGSSYVTGETSALSFPTTGQNFIPSSSIFGHAFVTKLNPSGSALVYSALIGGSAGEQGYAIAVDTAGSAYITGRTSSANFPTVNALRGSANLIKSANAGGSWAAANSGLSSLTVSAVAIDPSNSSTIYAATAGGAGIYKSSDGGTTWNALRTGFSSAQALTLDPQNPSTIYAAVNGNFFGVIKSTDGGVTWTQAKNGLSGGGITAIAVDPVTPSTVYAGTFGGVFKTTDGGAKWSAANNGLTFFGVSSIAIDPTNPSTIYASAGGGGVFKTTNGGANWAQVNTGLTNTTVRSLVVDPTNSSVVHAATFGGGVFKTTDGGANWSAANTGLTNLNVNVLARDPGSASTLYAGATKSGVFKTTDGGASWAAVYKGLSGPNVIALAVGSPATVFASVDLASSGTNPDDEAFVVKLSPSGDALAYSTYLGGGGNDAGYGIAVNSAGEAHVTGATSSADFPVANARQATPGGSSDTFVTKLSAAGNSLVYSTYLGGSNTEEGRAVAIDSAGNAYVTGDTASPNFPTTPGAFQTTLGNPSSSFPNGTGDAFVTKLDPTGTSFIYSTYLGGNGSEIGFGIAADSAGNAYITGNTGSSNFPLQNPLQATSGGGSFFGDAFVTKLNPAGSALVYSTYLGGSNNEQARGIALVSDGSAIVAGSTDSSDFPVTPDSLRTKSGLFRSTDGGGTWDNQNTGLVGQVVQVAPDPQTPSTLYAATSQGVFKSTNDGRAWSPTGPGLPCCLQRIAIDPKNPSVIYATSLQGVFKSTNGGASWAPTNNNVNFTQSRGLAIDPVSTNTIYVGDFGVFKSTDGGASWTAASSGIPQATRINTINIDPANPSTLYATGGLFARLYKSTNGGGSWSLADTAFAPNTQTLSVTTVASNPTTVFAITTTGLFKSTDGGATWASGFDSTFLTGVIADPQNPATLYLSVDVAKAGSPAFIYMSADGGGTWQPTSGPPSRIFGLAVNKASTVFGFGDVGTSTDAFVAKLSPGGSSFVYSTYLGGDKVLTSSDAFDGAFGVAADAAGNAYVTGVSRALDFPATPDAFQFVNRGFDDAFVAKLVDSFTVGGTVTNGGAPQPGVRITLSGDGLRAAVTGADGGYSFGNLRPGGGYTVSASKAGLSFAPPSQSFNNLSANQVADFSASASAATSVNISGHVAEPGGTPVPGTTVKLTGSQIDFAITDANGSYSFSVPAGGDYTVTPAALGFAFNPPGQTFNGLSANATADFSAVRQDLVVTNTNDHGAGSLRQALADANSVPGRDRIVFNIPGAGVKTISPDAAFPDLTGPVVIDAGTQPGYAGAPLVEIDGVRTGGSGDGLRLAGGDSVVRGLAIFRFGSGNGITLLGDGNVIEGCYLGINAAGAGTLPNHTGLAVTGSNNRVGGTAPAAGNVISGNLFEGVEVFGAGNQFKGNFIGTNPSGTAAVPNGGRGIEISSSTDPAQTAGNVIGGTEAGARNLVSGQGNGNIAARASGTVIQGNFIGTDVTGTVALGGGFGIDLEGRNSVVGGTTPAARNVISGQAGGIFISTFSNDPQNVIQGNFIGLDASGAKALGNTGSGIDVESPNAVIGGTDPGAGNVISGNRIGIDCRLGSKTTVQGNLIGTDAGGNLPVSNGIGVSLSSNQNQVGGTAAAARNVISGNAIAIDVGVTSAPPSGNVIQGNLVGLNAAGSAPLGNTAQGIIIDLGTDNIIGGDDAGSANTIAFNGTGVVVANSAVNNTIKGNSIFSNGLLGIDLGLDLGVTPNDAGDADDGGNHLQNFPVVTSATSVGGGTEVKGTLNSKPSTQFRIDFYTNLSCDASGNGEGARPFGSTQVTTDAAGNAAFDVTLPATLGAGRAVTATATDPAGNTSEFSPCDSSAAAGSVEFSAADFNVLEDVGAATVRVVRTGGSRGALTVNYSTVGGTATPGPDYTPASGQFTFAAGETEKTFTIPVVNDGVAEPEETVGLVLGGTPDLESLGGRAHATLHIFDTDTPLTVTVDNDPALGSLAFTEGDVGMKNQAVTVRLSAATGHTVTVDYDTLAGSGSGLATAGADFLPVSGTLTFAPGTETKDVLIPIVGDTIDEFNETFGFELKNVSGATLPSSSVVITILDDDPPPTVSVTDVTVAEGAGAKAVFSVRLSQPTGKGATVTYSTADGTATAGSDYTATSGSLTFSPGQTVKTVEVPVLTDSAVEPDETFFLNVASNNSTRATVADGQGQATIVDSSASPSLVQFAASGYSVNEADGQTQINVTRAGDTSRAASVDYKTVSQSASERSDFTASLGTLRFAPGETQKAFTVLVTDDRFLEPAESLDLVLSNPVGATLGGPNVASLTIVSDDTSDGPSPVGDASFDTGMFVRQHYHDFLNREPDTAGLQFWESNIDSCGPDAQCRQVKKINTSAAFFLSIEFQETGYLVYRTYKAAYGDTTSPNVSVPVPIVRLLEFLPDSQRIGQGVQVGIGDWQAQLEANKQTFMTEFVQRQRFTDAFPLSMTPAQFVDRLNQNAGGVLSQGERDQAVADLAASPDQTQGRAAALRRVAEDDDMKRNESNRAFVLMQYFGYLRRNPDDAPDGDFRGWQFWLSKLDQFRGNFVQAEMVKAFIQSDEYRHRFGQ